MQINKFLHLTILFGLFILPFLPLFVANSMFFPFITGKNFAFRIIVEIVFSLWLILALWDKSFRPKRSLILYGVGLLLLVATLATIFGVNPYHSFWSNFERMDGLITLLHLGALFLVMTSVIKKERSWWNFFYASLIANALVLFIGFGQLLGMTQIHQGGVRLDASLGNAAYLAGYCLFHIFLAGYLFFRQRSLLVKWLMGFSLLANIAILYFTATRGTILGLLGGAVLSALILTVRGWKKPTVKKTALSLALVILILVGLFWGLRDSAFVQGSPVLSRFASISLTEATTQSRFLIWQMAWQGFKEKPILGWGPGNFSHVFVKYYDPLMWRQEPWFDRAHNIIFDWLISAGSLGLAAYLFIFVSAIYYLVRRLWRHFEDSSELSKNKSKQKRDSVSDDLREMIGIGILVGLFLAYLFHNLFVFDNIISYFLYFSVLAFVHSVYANPVLDEPKFQQTKVSRDTTSLAQVGAVFVIILFVSGFYYLNLKPITASQNLIKAIKAYPQGQTQNLEYFQKVFAAETFASGEAREQLLNKTLSVLEDEALPVDLRNQFGQLSLDQWAKHLERFGEETRSRYYFGSFLSNIGMFDQALVQLQKAKELSPQKQMIRLELATLYLKMNKPNEAIAELKETFELEPSYPEARKMYALGLIIVGENKLAAEIIEPIKDSEEYFLDDRFVYYYNEANDREKINDIQTKRVDYYSQLVKSNPENLENYLKMAEAQIALGQNNEAKNSLQTIVDLASEEQKTLKTQAENLLQAI